MTENQMTSNSLGFSKDLFILPFDHRGSFQEKLFGIQGRKPTPQETQEIASYKKIIFEGFKKAIEAGVPQEKGGILVDEQFGTEILKEAQKLGFMTACPTEKSGQDEFDFEYGSEFGRHLSQLNPTFVKALVRYNPESDPSLNLRQCQKLKTLSNYCHQHHHKFMFELLVPATSQQLKRMNGDPSFYDRELRPSLMVEAMKQLQDSGIEPDVWKLEGIETQNDSQKVAHQAKAGGREKVGVIVLGRGENIEKVKHWLAIAATTPGLIGFAVGRTIFWEPLQGVKSQRHSPSEAADQISKNYKMFCDLWISAKHSLGST